MNNPADDFSKLSAFLDNELTESEAAEVKRKISNSFQWRTEYESLKNLDHLLKVWDRRECAHIHASSSFTTKLFKRIRFLTKQSLSSGTLFVLQSLFLYF